MSPTQRIEILITFKHSKKVDKTVEELKKDLEKNEMGGHYADEMEKVATYKTGIGTYMFSGLIDAMIIESSNQNAEGNDYLDKVFQKVMNSVEIKKNRLKKETVNLTSLHPISYQGIWGSS